jgi:hypothetical protein
MRGSTQLLTCRQRRSPIARGGALRPVDAEHGVSGRLSLDSHGRRVRQLDLAVGRRQTSQRPPRSDLVAMYQRVGVLTSR